MTNNTSSDKYDIATGYRFQLRLNPLKWLQAVARTLWQFFIIPTKIMRLFTSSILVFSRLAADKNLSPLMKVSVIFFTSLALIFISLPKVILYPVMKAALLCVLIEFSTHKVVLKINNDGSATIVTVNDGKISSTMVLNDAAIAGLFEELDEVTKEHRKKLDKLDKED